MLSNPGGITPTQYLGSACVGNVLTHSASVNSGALVFVSGSLLYLTDDYTVSGKQITFLVSIATDDKITVIQ